MQRFCVFCGNRPQQKNIEHVIPRWLIELTGEPKREAAFGPFWNERVGQLDHLKLPFDQFGFPACDKCNSKFSELESDAKRIMQLLLEGSPLVAGDFSALLSWLDKVRIGVWLGTYYLHKKVSDIEPHMFIESRLDKTDRLVCIYESDLRGQWLSFMGTDTPAFMYLPCCFVLWVNGLVFFNMAADFLISKNLGLPYPKGVSWLAWPRTAFEMVPGRERATYPLIKRSFTPHCTEIYQPMFARQEVRDIKPEWYKTEYVQSITIDASLGIGKVFFRKGQALSMYPDQPSPSWRPPKRWASPELAKAIMTQVLEFQVYLLNRGPYLTGLASERRGIVKQQHQLAKKFNRGLIKFIEKGK